FHLEFVAKYGTPDRPTLKSCYEDMVRINKRNIEEGKLIRQLADLDSLAFAKRGESESLGQTGGLRRDRGFRYVKILMEKVSGVCRGSRRTQPRYDACWRSH